MSRSTKPPSEKRRAANRANATRSTGPRTPEGKARSSQNARKHRFSPEQYSTVRLEDLDQLPNLRADAIAAYQPVNSQEFFAVERIAIAQQALLRCAALEAGLHTHALNMTVTGGGAQIQLLSDDMLRDIDAARSQNRSICLAVGFQRLTEKSDTWKVFLRHQAQTHRNYREAVEEFERLRALRSELSSEPATEPINEPINEPNNEPDTGLALPEELFPRPPEIDEMEAARRHAARTDPTVAVTSPFPPSYHRRE